MQTGLSIKQIEQQVFTPGLKRDMDTAESMGASRSDSLMAATNAHLNMLVGIAGLEKARTMLHEQAAFLEQKSGEN